MRLSYGLEVRVSIPDNNKRFSPLHTVQTAGEARPASYTMDIRGSFRGDKAAKA
jgi:hypothetical protein